MFDVCGFVDIGVARKNNQDKILINSNVYESGMQFLNIDNNRLLVAVADGIGGKQLGELASKVVLETFAKLIEVINCENYIDVIKKTSEKAYNNLIEEDKRKTKIDMGTTLTGSYIENETLITFNLGDSRSYVLKNDVLVQLTKDDSEVQIMIDMGMLEEKERNNQDNKNIITKFFNTNGNIQYPTVKKHKISLQKDNILLICSDGLTDYIEIEEMEEELNNKNIALMEKAKNLVNKAINNGSLDNISVILVQKM